MCPRCGNSSDFGSKGSDTWCKKCGYEFNPKYHHSKSRLSSSNFSCDKCGSPARVAMETIGSKHDKVRATYSCTKFFCSGSSSVANNSSRCKCGGYLKYSISGLTYQDRHREIKAKCCKCKEALYFTTFGDS